MDNKDRQGIKDSILRHLCDEWNNHKLGRAHSENQPLFDRKTGRARWDNVTLEMVMDKVVDGIWPYQEKNNKIFFVNINNSIIFALFSTKT